MVNAYIEGRRREDDEVLTWQEIQDRIEIARELDLEFNGHIPDILNSANNNDNLTLTQAACLLMNKQEASSSSSDKGEAPAAATATDCENAVDVMSSTEMLFPIDMNILVLTPAGIVDAWNEHLHTFTYASLSTFTSVHTLMHSLPYID